MGLLLLLTSTLLSSYFHPGMVADAQQSFTIRNITLTIEPSTIVIRDTNLTVRCTATVSSIGQEVLTREYSIYKDNNKVYTKTTSTSEDLLYPLPRVRVSDIGKYKCKINIEGKDMISEAETLKVTGLSKPVLHLDRDVVSEGEEVTARCTAPGETGSIYFSIYKDSRVIREDLVNSNHLEVKLRFQANSDGNNSIHCSYAVIVMPEKFNSEDSNTVNVSVKEFPISPVLEILPQTKIYEGDHLNIMCTISNFHRSPPDIHLYLSHGTTLHIGNTKVNYSVVALAKDPGDFECKLEMGNVVKYTKQKVFVTELFSAPTLTMSPAEVFQREQMKLTCNSESFASERITREELVYFLEPPDGQMIPMTSGAFVSKALLIDLNYTCVAKAKGIMKRSESLTVRPKVSVSTPKISVEGKAILGQPFKIRCHSETGSMPINYTLLWAYDVLETISIRQKSHSAIFTVTITKPEEINKFMCEARNNLKASARDAPLSNRLNASVIVPLTNTTLTVLPDLPDISEGDQLHLICGAKGTPPVTFRWYRDGNEKPLFTTTSEMNNTDFRVPSVSKAHSGVYYCEADNHANKVVTSEKVHIEVHIALWKKAVIGGVCLLVVALLVVGCVLYFKSQRDAAPIYDGMEGRVTNGMRDSVASFPADISNSSSYSIPATV